MPSSRISLAKVMSKANEHDSDTDRDQNRRWPGDEPSHFGESAGTAAARGALGRAGTDRLVRHATGRARRAGAPCRDDTGRTGRTREGSAAVDDPCHRRAGAARARTAGTPPHRPPPSGAVGHAGRQEAGEPGAPSPRRVARDAAERVDPAGAGDIAGRRTEPRRRVFSSLRNRNYRLFAAGQVVSNTGTWMQRVAQDWLVLELTHGSGTALGIATGLQFLPLLLFGLWGGAIADRYSKRRILMITQAAMGALALVLGVLAMTGVVEIWHVYALAFTLGLITVVDNPTRQTFAVEMVGRASMPNAIALNSAIFNLARIVGPAAAELVISAVGTPKAFLINAASYAAVLVGLKLMHPGELH